MTAADTTEPVTTRERVSIGFVVCAHVALLAWSAYRHSPTIDEPAYLAGGVSHWTFGRFDLTKVSPPLVRLVAAAPVYLSPHEVDWGSYRVGPGVRAEHAVGRDFIIANGRRSFWLFTLARWACIPFSIIGAWVCYRWSRQIWGGRSAMAALAIWCFCPNILAHGSMMTPDVGVTALGVAAAYAYWKWSCQPGWWQAVVAGAVLGFSVLAKTNTVVLLPLLPMLALVVTMTRQTAFGIVRQLVVSVLVAVYVINLGYGFEGSFERLGRYEFASQTFRGAKSTTIGNRFSEGFAAGIPVPFPKPFLEGIDLQRKDFENNAGTAKTYLNGVWYDHSWWWYYIYVVAVKMPLGLWGLILLSCATLAWQRVRPSNPHPENRPHWLPFIVIPGLALFAVAASQTGFGHSLRYVLPAFPFGFLLASGAFRVELRSRSMSIVAGVLLAWDIGSSLSVYPHSLSYFNEPAGGPTNGHALLLDGNLDWGQDLLYLEQWIQSHPGAKPLHVGFWSFLPLKELQADYSKFEIPENPEKPLPPGWYAVSVNHLRQDFRMRRPAYARFLRAKPVAMAGYSVYIYHITEDDALRL